MSLTLGAVLLAYATSSPAQVPHSDPVLRAIHVEGRERSQLYPLAQALLDSIGPRLTGSPEQKQANDWVAAIYGGWQIPVRMEAYGTWHAWHRGTLHVDLVSPRIRTLEGRLFAWSPGTAGPVEGPVVPFPEVKTVAEFEAWLPQVRGTFVLLSPPVPTCRPDENWQRFATPESFDRMKQERAATAEAWSTRIRAPGLRGRDLLLRLSQAGARGVLTSLWSQGWGVSKTGSAATPALPELDLSCEDYGLVFRLAARDQGPVLRVRSDAQYVGEVPASNVIAAIRGSGKPDEYVVLSAHLDSWDAASGATDNGSGTVVIMEAMRILREVYPSPKRTILAAHWNGEEQGLNGSRAFVVDRPEVVEGLQALLNLDNGTGRVVRISMGGFAGAGPLFRQWLSRMPHELTQEITLVEPGSPEGGTDHAAFTCHGAPAFNLSSLSWDYGTYTWHTNRDTFDKLIFDDLQHNAILVAMLAYLASEDSQRVPREPRVTQADRTSGQPAPWPACTPPARNPAR